MSSRDLEGRTVVITGANTGIGRATALDLGGRGARLILAGRSLEKTRPVLDELGKSAEFVPLDLTDLASVRTAAADVLSRAEKIHVLVNNAGLAGQRGSTKQGFELHFGVNHLGPFLFTQLLEPRLRAAGTARVVTVASEAHYRAKGIDWEAVRRPTATVTGFPEYAVSKLCNVLFTRQLAKRLAGTGVTTYALHPGVIASDIWRRIPAPFSTLVKLFMKTPVEGARTSIHCVTSAAVGGETGLYYEDCKTRYPSRVSQDDGLAAQLWEKSEEWTR